MPELRYEDPTFKTDFERFTHAGAPAELVALMAPLLRGWDHGGTPQAQRDAETFLHQQSLYGLMREPFEVACSHNEGLALLAKHGRKIDREVIRRYAPDETAIERVLDEQRPMPGAPADPIAVRATSPVRNPDQPGQLKNPNDNWSRPSDEELGIKQTSQAEPISYSDTGPRPFWEDGS